MSVSGFVYVLTGARGVGKSTICRLLAARASSAGVIVAGLVTETLLAGGVILRRTIDLRSGETRVLAVKCAHGEPHGKPCGSPAIGSREEVKSFASDPLAPGWCFDPGTFVWADEMLARALPCDFLVIDELGPLELVGGRGWVRALDLLDSEGFGVSLVVCRPELLAGFHERLQPRAPAEVFEVNEDNRQILPARIWPYIAAIFG